MLDRESLVSSSIGGNEQYKYGRHFEMCWHFTPDELRNARAVYSSKYGANSTDTTITSICLTQYPSVNGKFCIWKSATNASGIGDQLFGRTLTSLNVGDASQLHQLWRALVNENNNDNTSTNRWRWFGIRNDIVTLQAVAIESKAASPICATVVGIMWQR